MFGFRNKMKDHLVYAQLVSLTNMKMLVEKDICTNDEWQIESQKLVDALKKVHMKGGDYSDLAKALQDNEKRLTKVEKKAKKLKIEK